MNGEEMRAYDAEGQRQRSYTNTQYLREHLETLYVEATVATRLYNDPSWRQHLGPQEDTIVLHALNEFIVARIEAADEAEEEDNG